MTEEQVSYIIEFRKRLGQRKKSSACIHGEINRIIEYLSRRKLYLKLPSWSLGPAPSFVSGNHPEIFMLLINLGFSIPAIQMNKKNLYFSFADGPLKIESRFTTN